jgi:hypothetical protein
MPGERAAATPRASASSRATSPALTAGISYKDEQGRDIIHNETLFDAVVKNMAMKAAWQVGLLESFGKPVIIFIDEPAMELDWPFPPSRPRSYKAE